MGGGKQNVRFWSENRKGRRRLRKKLAIETSSFHDLKLYETHSGNLARTMQRLVVQYDRSICASMLMQGVRL